MKKLNIKIFRIVFFILTISILSFIAIYNIESYIEQEKSINNSLNVAEDNSKKTMDFMPHMTQEPDKKEPMPDENKNIKFMDSVVYTVLLDDENNIKEVINHTNNSINTSKITTLAKDILKSKDIKGRYIGCLYLTDYSYSYQNNVALIILDTSTVKANLWLQLKISLAVFLILEIIVFYISKKIATSVTEPVRETFEKQKRFIADASHELKTPLSVIVASSEALEDNPGETKWIKNIQNEASRMNDLITNLLELATSENKEAFKFENGDLSKVVELTVLTFEGKAFESNVKIDYEISPNIKMNMDEGSIKQLVEILLDNAIKHAFKDSTVKVILKENANHINLEVKNNGDNIPKGEEEKIFERFYRIDKSRNRKDGRYGLGLAIAKNIVSNHGGKISAMSEKCVTTFRVMFKK